MSLIHLSFGANAEHIFARQSPTFFQCTNNIVDGDFTLLDGVTTSVFFMHQQHYFSYAAGDGFQVIELPYAGSQLAFRVILPDAGQFDTVEQGLDAAALETTLAGLGSRELVLVMPKFAFASSASLADTLMVLGMTDAFDANLADFSGMVHASAPTPLVISDVLHKAFITVDEGGTEAAATTAGMMGVGAGAPPDDPLEVTIDHPFIFLIRDTQTGAVLFIGRVMDPSA